MMILEISSNMRIPRINTVRDTLKVLDNHLIAKMHGAIIKKVLMFI